MTPTELRFTPGQQASRSRTISAADVAAFAELIGDFNPVHVDEAFAARSRFGRRIAHGVFTAGLISAVLGNQLPGPGAVYLSQELRFTAPVFIGDTITAVVEVEAWRQERGIVTLKTECFNQNTQQVAAGKATLLVEELDPESTPAHPHQRTGSPARTASPTANPRSPGPAAGTP